MDVQGVINIIDMILDVCDSLDNTGGGVRGLTNGQLSTREVCRKEFGQFLLYIADGADSISDGQAAFMNIMFSENGTQIPAWKYKQLAQTLEVPDPSRNLTNAAFIQADLALSAQNGEKTTASILQR